MDMVDWKYGSFLILRPPGASPGDGSSWKRLEHCCRSERIYSCSRLDMQHSKAAAVNNVAYVDTVRI